MGSTATPAWQPFTLKGVAEFAYARWWRLLLLQIVVALLVAGAVLWQLDTGWFPTIQTAIEQLPDKGEIRQRQLHWPTNSPVTLAEGRFLALTVDLDHMGGLRSTAQLQVEFGRNDYLTWSQLGYGYAQGQYPTNWVIAFNRTELKPLWGAWKPFLLVGTFVGAIVYLMLSWWLLALLYCLPVWLAGFFANRRLTLWESWKLAGAALMPGAVLMLAALLLYGFGSMDLVQLLFVMGAHFVVGWLYLFLGLLFIPPITEAAGKKNPFATPPGNV